MREMKFREMNRYLGSMCYSDNCERGLEQFFGGIDGPIMQYTGLKDKNGKEIYEGDILKVFDCQHGIQFNEVSEEWEPLPTHITCKVVFNDRGWCLTQNGFNNEPSNIFCYSKEIIGNIHENPELLKGA